MKIECIQPDDYQFQNCRCDICMMRDWEEEVRSELIEEEDSEDE